MGARAKGFQFKNAVYFRVNEDFELPSVERLNEQLQRAAFVPTGPTQAQSFGWVPPRGKSSVALAEVVDGCLILRLCTERRNVPASAISAALEQRIERYKQETGAERVGSRYKREMKEEILLDLMPRAFTKQSATSLFLDARRRILVVDAGSLRGADAIVSALVDAMFQVGMTNFAVKPLRSNVSAPVAMAQWLAASDAPGNFTIDRDCELRTPDSQKSSVRYARHSLDIEEVPKHIASGMVVTQLALTWNDRVSFILTDGGCIRKLTMLDVTLDGITPADGQDTFDTNAAILTGELRGLLPDLLDALGGEQTEPASDARGVDGEHHPLAA